MKRPGSRLGGYAEEVAAAMRRRRDVRRPRVRVRVEHEEARVLAEDSPAAADLLVLARDLIGEPAQATPEEGREDAG